MCGIHLSRLARSRTCGGSRAIEHDSACPAKASAFTCLLLTTIASPPRRSLSGIACFSTGRLAVTGKESDCGAFKTPTLREVARAGPYIHDGSVATLENVIEFYNRGGNPNPYLDPQLHPPKLTLEEKRALVACALTQGWNFQSRGPSSLYNPRRLGRGT